jgi:SAM-dependent methyltransferase
MTFYVEHWQRLGCPAPLIEPICGTGLNMVWYLREGVTCDGLDASGYMLDECRKRLTDHGFQSRLYEQSLENLTLEQRYGFMFIPDRSFGHIYDKTLATVCLKRMYDHLKPGGWLIMDIRPPSFMPNFGRDGAVEHDLDEAEDGATIFTTSVWQHLEHGRVIRSWNKLERYIDHVLQETEIFDYHERLYDEGELREMLAGAGFKEIQVTKSYEHDIVPSGDDGMVFSCHKT